MNAFPSPRDPKTGSDDKGMSLRDYFAAKAMQGFLSNIESNPDFSRWQVADFAYKIADEMMRARDE